MQQVIASGGDPAGFMAKLFSGDATAVAQATAAGLSSSDIDLCKGMKNFYKTFASDSTCTTSGSVDTAANAAFNITSSSDFDTVNKTTWAAFSNVISGFKATDLSTSNMQVVVGLISQSLAAGGTNTSFTTAGLGDAIKNIFNASTEVTDFRLLGKAAGTILIKGGVAPTTLRDHSDIWSQYLKGNITSLSGDSPSTTTINSIGTVNAVINGATTAGAKIDLSSRKICSSAADCAGTSTPICSGNVCLAQTEQGYGKTGGATLGGTASRGTSCTKDDDCSVGLACNSSVCSLPCRTSSDCSSLGTGATCASNFCAAASTPTLAAIGGNCAGDSGCNSGYCLGTTSARVCAATGTAGSPGSFCDSSHPCGTGLGCSSQACGPAATVRVSGVSIGTYMASDATNLYFATSNGQISSINISDPTATSQPLASGLTGTLSIAVSGSTLYWSTFTTTPGQGGFFKIATSGGSSSTIVGTNSSCFSSNGIVTDGSQIYFGDGSGGGNGKIRKVSVSSTDQNPLTACSNVATVTDFPGTSVLVGTTNLFFMAGTGPYSVNKLNLSNNTQTSIASGLSGFSYLATDGTNVCWTEGTDASGSVVGAAVKCNVGGTTSTLLSNLSTLPKGVAISAGQVYVGISSPQPTGPTPPKPTGSLVRLPLTGGTATTLVAGVNPYFLQIVGNSICFHNSVANDSSVNGIMCAPK